MATKTGWFSRERGWFRDRQPQPVPSPDASAAVSEAVARSSGPARALDQAHPDLSQNQQVSRMPQFVSEKQGERTREPARSHSETLLATTTAGQSTQSGKGPGQLIDLPVHDSQVQAM